MPASKAGVAALAQEVGKLLDIDVQARETLVWCRLKQVRELIYCISEVLNSSRFPLLALLDEEPGYAGQLLQEGFSNLSEPCGCFVHLANEEFTIASAGPVDRPRAAALLLRLGVSQPAVRHLSYKIQRVLQDARAWLHDGIQQLVARVLDPAR